MSLQAGLCVGRVGGVFFVDERWNGPGGNPRRVFDPTSVKLSPSGEKQSTKEPVGVCTIYYGRVQHMAAGVTQSSGYKRRSVCRFPWAMLSSREVHVLESEASLGEASLCRLYQMLLMELPEPRKMN